MTDVAELRRLLAEAEGKPTWTKKCRRLEVAAVNALPALLAVAEAAETLSVADRAHQRRAADDDEGNAAFDADARAALWDTLCDAWCDFRAKLAALKEAPAEVEGTIECVTAYDYARSAEEIRAEWEQSKAAPCPACRGKGSIQSGTGPDGYRSKPCAHCQEETP